MNAVTSLHGDAGITMGAFGTAESDPRGPEGLTLACCKPLTGNCMLSRKGCLTP